MACCQLSPHSGRQSGDTIARSGRTAGTACTVVWDTDSASARACRSGSMRRKSFCTA